MAKGQKRSQIQMATDQLEQAEKALARHQTGLDKAKGKVDVLRRRVEWLKSEPTEADAPAEDAVIDQDEVASDQPSISEPADADSDGFYDAAEDHEPAVA